MSLEAAVEIPPDPRVLGAARRIARAYLDRWDASVDQEVVLLLVSELVTNAMVHARPPLELHLRWEAPLLRVSVRDDSPEAVPGLGRGGPGDEGGRGLRLVEALAHDWGVEVEATSKRVWFEVRG